MNELSKLHERIATGFNVATPEPPPLLSQHRGYTGAIDDDFLPEVESPEPVIAESHGRLRSALAGAGLLCSALVLATGIDAGFTLLSIFLATCGLVGTVLVLRDLRASRKSATSRASKQAEAAQDRAWERSETRHVISGLHDIMGDIAIVRDGKGRILEANRLFCRLTACDAPVGLTCQTLGLVFEPVAGAADRFRMELETIEGPRVFDWRDVIVREAGTGLLTVQSVARDVTLDIEQQRGDAALRRAERAIAAKSRLLATVSHEIRTPLSGILGMSHLLTQTRLTAEQQNYVAGLRQSGHSLVHLVDDLLDFASIEAGRFQLRPAPALLRETIESVVEMLSPRAHEKGIEIAATVSAGVPEMLSFDAARLRQVLFNVIGNAVKFTHQGGVLVLAGYDAGEVVLGIEDTGPGMDEATLARVFDEFEQAGDDTSRSGGTGLGLSISRRIVDAFGGRLTVTSRIGEGSRFEIRFPADASAFPVKDRSHLLAATQVLLMAPRGQAARALTETVRTLGGDVQLASTVEAARDVLERVLADGDTLTDIIVDHRHAAQFRRLMASDPRFAALKLRKTYLINPEERHGRPLNQTDGYHAWLIRPLRERSLVEVLKGNMKGMEVRDAINDNRPVLREVSQPLHLGRPGGVLVAEDDPVNALLVRATLEKAGHAVRVVGDFAALTFALHEAPEAVRLRPELIITDLNMPGGNGTEAIGRIRNSTDEAFRRVPVIVLTSDVREETVRKLTRAGADVVLAKPADPRRLAAEVERLLVR